ncbi:DUF1622 domain-containing protein [Adhaeribacter radiodurans]|uniref:DUF1622 domain-containing protein n=1 Tax=Adhaeribacter radiodurans TaxID=2745197 RepID=A0A7L7L2S8_9BACT|nr:DUF1622 domain-containing protein [Adhaeribacter radiodurans]QMU27101.1 DUF1622 domain-containing protein [Adhaeribacter radiodurans]
MTAPAGFKPEASSLEEHIINAVQGLKLLVETVGAIIIGMGVLIALYYFIRALLPPKVDNFNKIRLVLARYLALALEFQLGADILSTAIAPSWDQIGKLGAIAVIRTALNYFLSLEMKEEQRETTGINKGQALISDLEKKKADQAG